MLPYLMMIFVRVYNDFIYIKIFLIFRFVLEVVQELYTAHCNFENCILAIIDI